MSSTSSSQPYANTYDNAIVISSSSPDAGHHDAIGDFNSENQVANHSACAAISISIDEDRDAFARQLEQRLTQVNLQPNWNDINHIDHRFCSVIRSVLDKRVFRRNQLAYSVSRHARNIFTIRIIKYEGELGCVFTNEHTKLVSVKLSREQLCMDAHNCTTQIIRSYPPVVMQMHMAHLLRCMCVLQTWTKIKLASSHARDITKWARAVHQSYCTLVLADQQLPNV